jgi:DNA-binding transcriptional LysR family regulator
MPGLQQLVAFAETAKHGGFAAAARESGVAPSTLAKAVARLEHELGVRLFHRTTREVRLSPDGERLFRRCQRVLAELEDLRAEAASSRAAPAGTLRLSLPVHYGKRFVLPRLIALQQRHPGLRLDVRLSDSWEDLVRDGIDLAVRIGALADSSLVARRIDQQHLVLCASPAYLARRGTPKRIDELAGHEAVTFRLPASGRDRPWQFRQRGAPVELQPRPAVRAYESEALLVALKLGAGLCQLPDNMVEDEFADGTLVELLPSCRPEPLPIQLVHPPGRLLPARVRAAIDALDLLGLRRRAQ